MTVTTNLTIAILWLFLLPEQMFSWFDFNSNVFIDKLWSCHDQPVSHLGKVAAFPGTAATTCRLSKRKITNESLRVIFHAKMADKRFSGLWNMDNSLFSQFYITLNWICLGFGLINNTVKDTTLDFEILGWTWSIFWIYTKSQWGLCWDPFRDPWSIQALCKSVQ